jgi:site-specific recombinase XerD
MTQGLAKILSEIDDPDTIQDILSTTSANSNPPDGISPQTSNPTLSDMYNRFLARRQDRSPATRSQYKRTIPRFVEFAKSETINHPGEITIVAVDAFVEELQAEYDTDATILTYTKNVRTWLRWLHKRNLCDAAVFHILDKDELGLSPKARDEALPASEAEVILQKLRRRRRGTAMHSLIELLWNAGPRIGGVHSADLRDFDPVNNELRLRDRRETGTRLKNGSERDNTAGDGERNIALKDSVIDALQLYIETERPDVTDDYGRKPLFATSRGRASKSTLRRWVYQATSCRWAPETATTANCDGDCDPDTNVCPHSYYPHAIRRGSIVAHLSGGLRPDRASGRFDVSTQTLKKHYDPRTKRQRKEDRVDAVRDAWSE